QWAQQRGRPTVAVQHHHAHLAAVAAEHGFTTPLLGLALDGVGLGTDGAAWGGELLLAHGTLCRRIGHLAPIALPGGEVAAR
ncbi:MAG TPA: carbamoyltransferase HypF, partial [Rubrivivax sp.]|nr:carbamoyltransferase HypF [Rubrivivax sp.]